MGGVKNAGALVGKVLGKTPVGKVTKAVANKISAPVKSIGSKVGGAIKGLFGKKKKTVEPKIPTVPQPTPAASALELALHRRYETTTQATAQKHQAVSVDTTKLENKLDTLITLMRNGGIAVNLDGKKVGGAVLNAFNYG
jgi:hypothetical protein